MKTADDASFSKNDDLFLPKTEKGSLIIKLKIDKNDEFFKETQELQNHIKTVAESVLYEWKNFSIVLPPSLTGIYNEKTQEENFNMSDLFLIPNENELDLVSLDSSGKPKLLNQQQLKSIHEYGEFDVDSQNFPGQVHKWRLARWLQLGTVKSNQYFYKDLSKALEFIIVTAKNRIASNCFSLTQSLRSWKRGTWRLLDILIGLPAMSVVNFDKKLLEEEQKFLIAELTIDENEQERLKHFIQQFNACLNKYEGSGEAFPEVFDVPYFYRTPDGLLIDLRLFDYNLRKKMEDTLNDLLDFKSDDDKTWFINLRKRLILEFKSQGISNEEIMQKTSEKALEEYFERVFDKVLKNEYLNSLSPKIGQTLVDHAKSVLIMKNSLNKVKEIREDHLNEYKNFLIKNYRIKSNVKQWLDDCIAAEKEKFNKKNLLKAHEIAIEDCKMNNLHQAAYFLNRECVFRKTQQNKLIREFSQIKVPSRSFSFDRLIWLPKNWIILKNEKNREPERVFPVEFSDLYYEDVKTYPRNENLYYTVETHVSYHNSTKYPFWRWTNFILRTFAYLFNTAFFLGVVIPFCSPVSFTALFKLSPFYPNKRVNTLTGQIHPSKSPKINTLISRLKAVWVHVFKSRDQFERIPDKGLIGKSIQRIFNVIWNYLIVGTVGTLGVTIIVPTICLGISTVSVLGCLTSPIWFPVLNICLHILADIFFDFDSPYINSPFKLRLFPLIKIILGNFLIGGVIQPIASILTAFLICPTLSVLIVLYATLRKSLRKIWDSFMFYVVLKPRARIPSRDTFVARRFAGPGLASNYFYQISVQQALAALEAHLEIIIVREYLNFIDEMIQQPLKQYQNFFNILNKPFSCEISYGSNSVKSTFNYLQDKTEKLRTNYNKAVDNRINLLNASISSSNLSKIRLINSDLKILLAKGTEIVKTQYIKNILPYQRKSVNNLFEDKGLDENDWSMLTGIILEDIFGKGFLQPLEETDNYFRLEINHLNLKKYTAMIANSELRDDLDLVMTRYSPKSGRISVKMPNESSSLFNPLNNYSSNYSRRYDIDQLLTIPSRLPMHPGIISLMIQNHDNKMTFEDIYSILDKNFLKRRKTDSF